MFDPLVHQIGKAAYPLFERLSPTPWDNAPRPVSPRAVTHGAGHDPDRVLLTGGSSSVGWGVVTHDLGLAGHLARATAALTGRGADVEVHSHPRLAIPAIERDLAHTTISRFDAVVLTLGGRESFELLPVRIWRTQLSDLLDHILVGREAAPGVIIVGAEETSPVPLARVAMSVAMARARAFNEATREVIAGRPRVTFVESRYVPSAGNTRGVLEEDQGALYERSAAGIAPTLADLLDHAPDRVRHPVDDDARGAALRYLRDNLETNDPRVTALMATVRDAMHMRSADLFVVDRDEVRSLAATDLSVLRSTRERALSSEALEHPGGLVIPDLSADPRHKNRPEVAEPPHLRFYASYPVESPDGHPVAVLSVVGTEARDLSRAELSLLRQFAHQTGALLFADYVP